MKTGYAFLLGWLCAGLWAGGHALTGYVDTTGKVVITPQFRAAEGFHEGRAMVTLADETRVFIDHKGKPVFPAKCAYGSPHDFHAGMVWVQPDRFVHCLDSLGRSVFPDSFPGAQATSMKGWRW